jgi:hypothetical protein
MNTGVERFNAKTPRRRDAKGPRVDNRLAVHPLMVPTKVVRRHATPPELDVINSALERSYPWLICVSASLRLCVKIDALRQTVDHAINTSLQHLNAKTPRRRDAKGSRVDNRLAVHPLMVPTKVVRRQATVHELDLISSALERS